MHEASGMGCTRHEIDVVTPFRLDLTVSALRRLSTNIVDRFTHDQEYVRVLPVGGRPVIVHVTQPRPDSLVVRLEVGTGREHRQAVEIVRRVLGVDRDVASFDRAARRLPWLRSLAIRMRGVKPPRYPTLWEACVNSILFQQVYYYLLLARLEACGELGRASPERDVGERAGA